MDYRVLGPIAVQNSHGPLPLGGPRQQTVLAVLLCHVNHTVDQDALIDAVWSGEPPAAAKSTLQTYVYGLRQALGSDQIERGGGGYRIELDADRYDALQFEGLVKRGRASLTVDPTSARTSLVEALGLWYGSAFGGLDDNPVVMAEAARLSELRLTAIECRIEAELAIGAHDDVVGELRTLVREHPLRERFRAQQMLALYRAGRQAEALEAFQQARALLGEELGLDPSSELRDLEQRILAQDPTLLGGARHPKRRLRRRRSDRVDTGTGPEPGRGLRGYELRDPLGHGDFGTVFRAFQPSVGREVAIKAIRPEYANRPTFVQRFEREAQLVAQLEHPHIIPLFDYWRDAEGAYLVMPLLRGGSLAQTLRHGGWNLAPALQLLGQVGGALAHAHRRGVVHRDVKPSNVLLDEADNAYLSDFGIAVRLADDAAVPVTTSLGYVPPEELRGAPLTAQSDVFALGVLTHELLTGLCPPTGGSLPPVTQIRPDLPPDLEAVLGRATDDNPARRHEKVEDFLREVRRSVGTDVARTVGTAPPTSSEEPARNPYKGLRAFRETDAADFFGRDALIDELLEAVANNTLVTVVGPSGSGKSSVVRAGLVPRLRAGGLPRSRDWLITDMFPGSYPFEELEAALRRIAVDHHVSLLDELNEPQGLLRATKNIVTDEDATVVLLIDQFEELFSGVGSEATRRLFLENLTAVATDERSRVRVVLTLRADFFGRPLQYAEFAEAMAPGLVSVGPPSRDGLAQAISAPARGVGVDLEPGLVGRIIADVEDQPGGLPLLQYALTELFASRTTEKLTVADYELTGGVTAAIGRRAEELYAGMPTRTQDVVRDLFLRLVSVREASAITRRRAPLSELRALTRDEEMIDQVLHDYGSYRLLSFDRDPTTRGPTVEVAHEALLGEWPRLRDWVDERREDLTVARRVARAAQEWEDADKDPSFLMRGARLEQAEHWREDTDLALTAAERALLDASLEELDADRRAGRTRRNRLLTSFVLTLMLVSALAITAVVQRGMARDEARNAHVRELAIESALALEEDPERAVLIALAALDLSRSGGADPLPEAIGALQQTVQEFRLVARHDVGGSMAPLGGDPGSVLFGDLETVTLQSLGDAPPVTLPGVGGGELPTAASAGAELFVVGLGQEEDTASVRLFDRDGEPVDTLDGPDGQRVFAVDISPGGGRVAATACSTDPQQRCTDRPMTMAWDVATSATSVLDVDAHPSALAFVDDDTVAVALNGPSGIALWDLATGATETIPLDIGEISTLAADPDGARVAVTGLGAGEIAIVDVERRVVESSFPSSRELALAWSPDGERLAATGFSSVVRVFDVASGQVELQLRGADDNLFHLAFTPSGDELLASTFDRTWQWDVTPQGPPALGAVPLHMGPPSGYTPSPGGGLLGAFSGQSFEVVEVDSGRQVAVAPEVQVGIGVGAALPNRQFTVVGILAPDGGSSIRQLPDLAVVRELEQCTNAIAFSDDGSLALVTGDVCSAGTGNGPERARVLRVDDGETILELDHQWVFSAAFNGGGSSEAGQYVALTDQRIVELYDLATGEQVTALSVTDLGSQEAGHLILSFDPTGHHLAVGMSDGRTWVIDVPALVDGATVADAVVFNQVTHTGAAPRAELTADGVLATAGFDGLVRLWDLEDGAMLTEIRADLSVGTPHVTWTADGRELLYNSGGVIRRFPRDVDDLVARAESMVTRSMTPDECLRHLGPNGCDA